MKINNAELLKLFKKIKDNDRAALNEFFEKYRVYIYSVACAIVSNSNDANDVVQNVSLKLLELTADKLPNKNAAAWLYQVSRNEALMYLRKRKPTSDISECIFLSTGVDMESDVLSEIIVASYMKKLTPKEKEILLLKASGLTYSDASKFLSVPPGTLMWRYNCAIKKIKKSIEEDKYENSQPKDD